MSNSNHTYTNTDTNTDNNTVIDNNTEKDEDIYTPSSSKLLKSSSKHPGPPIKNQNHLQMMTELGTTAKKNKLMSKSEFINNQTGVARKLSDQIEQDCIEQCSQDCIKQSKKGGKKIRRRKKTKKNKRQRKTHKRSRNKIIRKNRKTTNKVRK